MLQRLLSLPEASEYPAKGRLADLEEFLSSHKRSRDFAIWMLALELTAGRARLLWDEPQELVPHLWLLQSILDPPMSVKMNMSAIPAEGIPPLDMASCDRVDQSTAVSQLAIIVSQLGKASPAQLLTARTNFSSVCQHKCKGTRLITCHLSPTALAGQHAQQRHIWLLKQSFGCITPATACVGAAFQLPL